jgi:signal transduction histidine kinase
MKEWTISKLYNKIQAAVLVCCIFLLLIPSTSKGQRSDFRSGYKIEIKDGLSGINVRKIIQDPAGFTWIATQEGLNRFDGIRFHKFVSGSTEAGKNLLGSDVYDLAIDTARDELYAVTAYYGLNVISLSKNQVSDRILLRAKSTKAPWITACASGGQYVFCGTDTGIIFRYNKISRKHDLTADVSSLLSPLQKGKITKMLVDGDNKLWLCIDDIGILVTDTSLKKLIHFYPGKLLTLNKDNFGFAGMIDFGKHLLIATTEGIRCISSISGELVNPLVVLNDVPQELLAGPVKCGDLKHGGACFVTPFAIYIVKANKWNRYPVGKDMDDRNWLEVANALCLQDHSVIIGGQYGLLWVKNTMTPFTAFSVSPDSLSTKIPHSTTLYSENDSTLLVCATTDIFKLNTNTGVINKFNHPDFYFNIFSPDKGLYVAAGNKGTVLTDIKGNFMQLSKTYPELHILEQVNLISVLPYHDSLFFIVTEKPTLGIYIWNRLKKSIGIVNLGSTPVALKSLVINRLFLDSKHKIWIIGDDIVSIYDHEHQTIQHLSLQEPLSGEPLRINMDICETRDHFWLAVYGMGIVKVKKDYTIEKIYSLPEGLKSTGLYKLFAYSDSLIFASSNNGIAVLQINTGKIFNYFQSDGLMSDNFEETSGIQAGTTIFFGGERGVVRIEPEKLSFDGRQLKLFFTDFEIIQNGKVINFFDLNANRYTIPAGYERASLYFTALGAVYPDKIRFQVRNREKGNDWTDLDGRRFIELTLEPGTYHIEIRAANEDGTWGIPKTITLHFEPKWYQTLAFKIGVCLLVLSLLYALYRYRISQIRKQHQIRKDIASDLHDDIGSTLNSVKLFTHLAIGDKNKAKYLEQAKESLAQASVSLRDMIWVLDDQLDTGEQLITRLQQFIMPLANAIGMEVKLECSPAAREYRLQKNEKRNLLLICKEAMNNCIKYAEASLLKITIDLQNKRLHIQIQDNGKGFDMNDYKAGNGIKNLQYRGKQIGYSVTIQSEPGKGTSVTLVAV